jgi:hypothetical protein
MTMALSSPCYECISFVQHIASALFLPLAARRFLKDLGFAGGSADIAIRKAMHLWHIYVLTSTAFFNSPRGR